MCENVLIVAKCIVNDIKKDYTYKDVLSINSSKVYCKYSSFLGGMFKGGSINSSKVYCKCAIFTFIIHGRFCINSSKVYCKS